MDATEAEIAYRHALGVMRNLESQQETVSRQIACVQAAAKILDRFAFESRTEEQAERARNPDEENTQEEDPVTNWDKLSD